MASTKRLSLGGSGPEPTGSLFLDESKIDRSGGPLACHPCTGRRDADGYGRLYVRGVGERPVSRIVLEAKLGRPLGEGMKALHSCDNPPCVNAAHLSEGTQAQNIADRDRRGRTQRGAGHYKAALTDAKVVDIFRRCQAGESYAAIARDVGVGGKAVSHIAHGTNWKHVTAALSHSPAVSP